MTAPRPMSIEEMRDEAELLARLAEPAKGEPDGVTVIAFGPRDRAALAAITRFFRAVAPHAEAIRELLRQARAAA